jgi:SAM-dependent methyltransferase
MLAEHLTQEHDRASRRSHIIDQHVGWIHQRLLHEEAAHILDLGCGPGLYSNRLAALGHTCVGIDYSPASIRYAQTHTREGLQTTYLHEDMRTAHFGQDFGLVMMLFGEVNVFSQSDATQILTKAFDALMPGGFLLLEAHTYASLIPEPNNAHKWFTSSAGLFSPTPHIALIEQYWHQDVDIATTRYYIIDAITAEVTRYAQSMQAYSAEQYEQLLNQCGYVDVEILPGLAVDQLAPSAEFQAIIARKPS